MANLYQYGGSSISQEDWNEALALAERWREVRTDESHGATGKNLGLLARALLHLEVCYNEMVKLEGQSDVQRALIESLDKILVWTNCETETHYQCPQMDGIQHELRKLRDSLDTAQSNSARDT